MRSWLEYEFVAVYKLSKKKDALVPPAMAERKRPVSGLSRFVVVTSVLFLRRSGHIAVNAPSKKGHCKAKSIGGFFRRE